MSIIKGLIVEEGDSVRIGDKHARDMDYDYLCGKVCTYVRYDDPYHQVKDVYRDIWYVLEEDVYPLENKGKITNRMAAGLLDKEE